MFSAADVYEGLPANVAKEDSMLPAENGRDEYLPVGHVNVHATTNTS